MGAEMQSGPHADKIGGMPKGGQAPNGVVLPDYHSARPDGAVNGGAQSTSSISTIVGPG